MFDPIESGWSDVDHGHRWLGRIMAGGKADKNYRIAHNVSSRKRVDIISRAKQLGVKVTNPKAKVTTEI